MQGILPRNEARSEVVPLISLLTGCAALFALMTVPFVPIVLGLASVVTGIRGRSHLDPMDRAMTTVGIAFGVVAVVLCWMTPGFVSIIWGS